MTAAQKPDALPVVAWKCGDEFLPYHPSASHVHPDHRDGWNACYRAAQASLLAKDAECEALREDAARWRTFEKVLARGLPGPAHKRQVRVIEVCPMYGDEKEIANVRAAIDAARAAADQGGA